MWFTALFSDSRAEAASRIQAAARGRRTRTTAVARGRNGTVGVMISPSGKSRAASIAALQAVHASCDLVDSGASASELLEKVSVDPQLLEELDAMRPNGAARVLHSLELRNWLDTGGRVTLQALCALV